MGWDLKPLRCLRLQQWLLGSSQAPPSGILQINVPSSAAQESRQNLQATATTGRVAPQAAGGPADGTNARLAGDPWSTYLQNKHSPGAPHPRIRMPLVWRSMTVALPSWRRHCSSRLRQVTSISSNPWKKPMLPSPARLMQSRRNSITSKQRSRGRCRITSSASDKPSRCSNSK